jgi:ureidoglycolate hydrolase
LVPAWCVREILTSSGIGAFIARGDQAVNHQVLNRHHTPRASEGVARFDVLIWTTGRKPDDEEWVTLREPIQVEI